MRTTTDKCKADLQLVMTYQHTQAAGLEFMFSELAFQRVFAANDGAPRIETRVWPDGVRTDNKTDRAGAGLPLMKSVVVR